MKWFQLKAVARAAAENAVAEILIYGVIGESYWTQSVVATDAVKAISEVTAKSILVRINSPGGSVADGTAIHNALRAWRLSADDRSVTVRIEGQAASIASVIAMAGDTVEAFSNTSFMVHAPWAYVAGNAEQMREYADVLDKLGGSIATSYARKTGKGTAHAMAYLTDGKDHYFTAAEAKAEGFIDTVLDEVTEPATEQALTRTAFAALFPDLKREALAQLRHPKTQPLAAPRGTPPEPNMTPEEIAAKAKADALAAVAKAEASMREGMKARLDGVLAMFALVPDRAAMAELESKCLADLDCTPEEAGKRILTAAAAAAKAGPAGGKGPGENDPTKGRAQAGADAADKRKEGVEKAILAKAGIEKIDAGNEFNGQTLLMLAHTFAAEAGANVKGKNKLEVVAAAFTHSTSDFPSVLANIAHKSMLKGYDEAEETFQRWTSENSLSDYKLTKRVALNSMASLPQIQEGGEYGYATVGDHGENVLLAKYGRLFSITREAMINDDLGCFTMIPRKMGRAAIRTIGDLVYAILTSNPLMTEDGVALFNAAHANLAATGTPITSTNVDLMRQAMALQKDRTAKNLDANGNPTNATALGIRLGYLVVPVALGAQARIVRDSQFQVDLITAAKGSQNTIPNPVKGIFDVIEDYRLDANSSLSWYGAANQATNDTIEVSYLDGNKQPWLETQNGWSVDGVQMKVRIEATAKALDYKGMQKNPGA